MINEAILVILISTSTILGCLNAPQSKAVYSEKEEILIEHEKVIDKTADHNKMINRLHFSIDIKADKEEIWNALWDDKKYRDWAGVFDEGSHYVVDNWEEGSKILFLGSDKSGIYSVIERHIPYKIIQFKHIGNVVGGREQPVDDEVTKWSGAKESYSLKEGKGFYTLLVEIDVLDEHVEFMSTKLPIALEKIKKNSR